MAQLGTAIDFEQVEDRKEFGIIPPQDVLAAMTDSKYEPNKANTGHTLTCEFQILEGEFAGRKVWNLLNLDNPSADAVRIAQSELKQIVAAVGMIGKMGVDTSVLHNIPLILTLEVEPEKTVNGKTYKPRNKISSYKPVSEGATAPPAPQAAANKPQATAAPAATTPKAGLPPFLANKK